MTLEVLLWAIGAKFFRRAMLISSIAFFQDHLFRFLNNSTIKSAVVVLDISFSFIFHFLLAQMNSKTNFE